MQIKRRKNELGTAVWPNYSPLIQQLYMARGLTYAEASIELSDLLSYHDLLNIQVACDRLCQALDQQEKIVVIGDFDADGATATTLAVSALKAMGAKQVTFLVPNRFLYGYGLTPGIVEQAALLQPSLLLTVDNGISNHEGVLRAKNLGMDVIITDHHLAGETLPVADVIINPNQAGDRFPSKAIAGVGVVFYLMSALRRELERRQWFQEQSIPMPNMAQFLDLVALGTVADVVPLDRNNRIMVKQGLARIQKGLARPGILALLAVAGREAKTLKTADLGFAVAPRLNAAGRLDDMSLGIHCLLATTFEQAEPLAHHLDELNQERRKIEGEMQAQALGVLQDALACAEQKLRYQHGIALFQADWHQGVIGILAGRIKDKFGQPTIVFARGDEGELKGSARSITGINIRDVLASMDSQHPGLLLKFGGHAMAAGLTIKEDKFQHFAQLFNQEIASLAQVVATELLSDGSLPPTQLSLLTAEEIIAAGPWGQQFPEPLFDDVFRVVEQRLVGQCHLKLLLQHPDAEIFYDAIAFQVNVDLWPNHRARWVRIAYQLDINVFQGRRRLQLLVKNLAVVEQEQEVELG